MHDFMDHYYEDMKKQMGLNTEHKLQEQDPPLSEVLALIKPNVTAKNFKDYL